MKQQEDYLKNRLDDQIKWYGKKSKTNQNWHKRLQTIKVILAVSIPVVTLFINDEFLLKIVVAVLGALIAVLESVARLNSYKELWITYRMISEALKRERILFDAAVEPYNGDNAFKVLVGRCEKIMATENTEWSKFQAEISSD